MYVIANKRQPESNLILLYDDPLFDLLILFNQLQAKPYTMIPYLCFIQTIFWHTVHMSHY